MDQLSEEEKVVAVAYRIINAAEQNRGCRLSAEECELLTRYNLPCTVDDPSVRDDD